MEFDVILEQDETGAWIVSVPALPGCHTQGATREEALGHAREAIELHLEVAKPEPVFNVQVARVSVKVPPTP